MNKYELMNLLREATKHHSMVVLNSPKAMAASLEYFRKNGYPAFYYNETYGLYEFEYKDTFLMFTGEDYKDAIEHNKSEWTKIEWTNWFNEVNEMIDLMQGDKWQN